MSTTPNGVILENKAQQKAGQDPNHLYYPPYYYLTEDITERGHKSVLSTLEAAVADLDLLPCSCKIAKIN